VTPRGRLGLTVRVRCCDDPVVGHKASEPGRSNELPGGVQFSRLRYAVLARQQVGQELELGELPAAEALKQGPVDRRRRDSLA
jgi:hypothetical protein